MDPWNLYHIVARADAPASTVDIPVVHKADTIPRTGLPPRPGLSLVAGVNSGSVRKKCAIVCSRRSFYCTVPLFRGTGVLG